MTLLLHTTVVPMILTLPFSHTSSLMKMLVILSNCFWILSTYMYVLAFSNHVLGLGVQSTYTYTFICNYVRSVSVLSLHRVSTESVISIT